MDVEAFIQRWSGREGGRVLILKELHEQIDAAVFEAYGWPTDLADEQILERLVALNAERAKEEAAGHVRWLRPDYQIPRFAKGVERKRVGILPEGKAPAREGTGIADADGKVLGNITSGGYGPSVGGPIAMGYIDAKYAAPGTKIFLAVRGKDRPAVIVNMPFIEKRFHKPK